MRLKTIFKLLFLSVFVLLIAQSCTEDNSFGEDLEVAMLPSDISYPDILDIREFSHIESAAPFMNTNGKPVTFELASIKKDDQFLDDSYLNAVTVLNYSEKESEIEDPNDPDNSWIVITNDLSQMGKVVIEEGNPFANGEYLFSFNISAEINGTMESRMYEDALRLVVGPALTEGISYCPFKMNFVSGESTKSNPVEKFGGNDDVRYELATEADKLNIDPVTGEISLNPSYSISAEETIMPIINVISNISEEVVSFEETFTAVLSTTPIVLDKEKDFFFFPTLKPTARQNVQLGGDGYSNMVVEFHKPDDDWYNEFAYWRGDKNNKAIPPPPTQDAVDARAEAGVSGTNSLELPFWGINAPSDSYLVMDAVNLALYEGCFTSKMVYWTKLNYNTKKMGYEADGSAPIDFEVLISTNYTGDPTTTTWTQVNDILECEINDNGTIFTGTPYPGDQTGADPDGLKDPAKNANKLWVRGELDLEDYKTETSFTVAFRLKTYFDTTPNKPLVGTAELSNVHFVASEK
ncbi:hypothetical protein [Urechidicola vernalis]|uniref:DUF1735 domain-containing protein n=1 Tax=Urechidicola vernalis TaxID=3075600 RepID=A0ABU2Y457_9FLAO|nr:hypothetical protein [Urechidicola sp. P050]MDT0551833.1 hypothetical protein [Urechidicola sp. P050]